MFYSSLLQEEIINVSQRKTLLSSKYWKEESLCTSCMAYFQFELKHINPSPQLDFLSVGKVK